MFGFAKKTQMPNAKEALPGRPTAIPTARQHFVNGKPLKGPYPEGFAMAMFGLGCFWGAERKFWELGDGVYATAAGYAGAGMATRRPAAATGRARTGRHQGGQARRRWRYAARPLPSPKGLVAGRPPASTADIAARSPYRPFRRMERRSRRPTLQPPLSSVGQ